MMRKRVSVKTRLLSFALTVVMVLGVMPLSAFAIGQQKKNVVEIETAQLIDQYVPFGTLKEDIGLPTELSVMVETQKTETNSDSDQITITEISEKNAAVNWEGNYDGNTAGEYILTAAFADDSYVFEDTMPSVKITVQAKAEEKMEGKTDDESEYIDLKNAIDALPEAADVESMSADDEKYIEAKNAYNTVMEQFYALTDSLDDDAYSAFEEEITEERMEKLAFLEMLFSNEAQVLSLPENSPDLFITLKGAGNTTAFGVENEEGVFEDYRIGTVGLSGGTITSSTMFRFLWMANLPALGTSETGRVVKITVPHGFEIKVWNADVLGALMNGTVVTAENADGSKTYTLRILDDASINGQIGQSTEVAQNALTVFNDYYPGKTYDFVIEYYTDEQTDAIMSDRLVFKPTEASAKYTINNTLNDMQYAPDSVGDNYKLTEHSIFTYYGSTYANRGTSSLPSNSIPSDYQTVISLGKMYYSSTNNANPAKNIGQPYSRLLDMTSNGAYGGLNPYPGILPAVTVEKTAGYLQKGMTITIPLPAYADGSSSSLRLYDCTDGKSGLDRVGTNYLDGTCVYFQPEGTNDLYLLPNMNAQNNGGVYKAEFDAANEVVTIKMAPELYVNKLQKNNYYYIDGNTSYMDLLSKSGKIYVNLCVYADATKLLNPQFLGKAADGTVGDDHQIVAKDEVSVSYTDTKNNGAVVITESEDKLMLNFHANDPEITYTSNLSKNKDMIQEQAFNTDSKHITESVALAPKSSQSLLQNWYHIGGRESNLDLGRGQTNIYFDYTYEQAYSPISFNDLFNGISHSANSSSYRQMNQNTTYTITITDAKTGAMRTLIVDGDWKDSSGAFSNEVTTEQLALNDNEYVSNVRIKNPIAYISGLHFNDNSTNAWGLFTASYRAKDKVYESGVEKELNDGYVATVSVKYGSDQVAQKTMEQQVKLIKTLNNFTVGTYRDYGNAKSYGAIPVNDNSSIYTLYGFYVRKYADTMLYDEDDYPTITVSGQGLELSDTIALDYSTNSVYEDRYNYYRKAVVPVSYVNQDGETVSLNGIDWSLPQYNLGNETTFNTYVEKRYDGQNNHARGYVLTDIFEANGDSYAKSVTLELRMNHIDANNSQAYHTINIWLACHKLKPGYLNYNGVVGTNDTADIGEDWKDTSAKSYEVNVTANSSQPFNNTTKGKAILNVTADSNHILKNIYKNTYRVVYGIKYDQISVTDFDHYLNPIDTRWTGTDVPDTQTDTYIGMFKPYYNVPFSGSGSAADKLARNKETALTEINFDAQYSVLKKTVDQIPNADCKATEWTAVDSRGPFDYKRISFDFAGSDSDLLALTNGFAINTYGGYQYVSGIDVEYTTNQNSTERQETLKGRISWVDSGVGEKYVYYDLRDLLQDGEYFTFLKLTLPEEWSEFIRYDQYRYGADDLPTGANANYRADTGMPNIRLTRIGALPKVYPVSGTMMGQLDDGFDGYDKLDVKCTMSYTDVFDTKTDVQADGKTSRIVGQMMTVEKLTVSSNRYSNKKTTSSDPTSSTFQGGTTNWSNSFYINYSDNGSLDSERKVKPIIYYKINSEYVPNLEKIKIWSLSTGTKTLADFGATASYLAPGLDSSGYSDYGILVVDFKDTEGMSQLSSGRIDIQCELDVKADAQMGNNVPVPEMWLDIPYDRDTKNNNTDNDVYDYSMGIAPVGKGGVLNSQLYGTNYNNDGNSQYPGQVDSDGNGAVMLSAAMPQEWNIMKYIVAGVKVKAISHYPYTYAQHVSSRDLTITADDDPNHYIFQSEATIITPLTKSQNWAVYIPIPNKNEDNDFGMKLVGIDVSSLKNVGATGLKVYYTNSEDFTENELNTGGTDTEYVEWTSGDVADLKDATCIKVTIDEMPGDTRGRILCSYKLDERKSVVGEQNAEIKIDAAYDHGGLRINPFVNANGANILTYTLKDMTIHGNIWTENDWNSVKDAGDAAKDEVAFMLLMDNDIVDQASSEAYKSDANGNYMLLAPREGVYQVKITVPEGYELVKKLAGTDKNTSSWFDRTTSVTDEFEVKADSVRGKYSFETVMAGIAKTPVITLDSENAFIHVTDTHAGTITSSVENRVPDTTVSFALKDGSSADIASIHDHEDGTADFDGLKTGVTNGTASIDDGYGGVVTKDFAITVYGNVKYDNNTGTGTVTDNAKYYPSVKEDGSDAKTDEVTVKDGSALSKTGYLFDGWNEKADGTGTQYAANSKFQTGTVVSDITLYAQWKPIEYSVKFDKNTKSENGLALSGTPTGSMADQGMVYDEASNLTTNAYVLDGYDFNGWKTRADGSGTAYADEESVINLRTTQGATITLYAQWTPHTYTIVLDKNTVDSDGNALVGTPAGTTPEKAMTYGKEDNLPANEYSLTGYTFGGWIDENGTTYTDEQEIKNLTSEDGATVTLKAIWNIQSFNVSYEYGNEVPNAPALPASSTNNYNAEVTIDPDAILTGYDFSGWSVKTPEGTAITDGMFNMPASDVVLEGSWTAHTYTIVFDKNTVDSDGNPFVGTPEGSTPDKAMTYNQADNLTANGYSLTGYTFGGWIDENGTTYTDEQEIKNLTSEDGATVTLKAIWNIQSFNVSYEYGNEVPNAPALPASSTNNYNAEVTIDPDAVLTGYDFSGWSVKTPEGTAITDGMFNMPASDVVLEGSWTAHTYTIVFDKNTVDSDGNPLVGTPEGSTPDKAMTYNQADNLTANGYSLTGYTFGGWIDESGTTYTNEQEVNNLTSENGAMVTLKAVWNIQSFNVSYEYGNEVPNAPALPASSTNNYNAEVTIDPDAVLTGYDFSGWRVKTPEGTAITDGMFNMPASDVVLEGSWTAHTYTIVFDKNTVDSDGNPLVGTPEGSTPDKAMTYNQADNLTANGYSLTGYTFGGWIDESGTTYTNEQEVNNLTSENGAMVTLKAVWNIQSFNVSYEYGNEVPNAPALPASSTNNYNAEVTIDPDAVLTGYDFSGWRVKTPEGTAITDGMFNMPASDVVLEGSWTAHTYTVVYDKNADEATGTTAASTHTYDVESKLTANGYINSGFVFAGWSLTPDGDTVIYEDEATVKNLTPDNNGEVILYAVWTACTPVTADPPVQKEITGHEDPTPEIFVFKLDAESNTVGLTVMPMPAAANGEQSMEAEIVGAGSLEFGIITFTKPGTYVYKITELDNGLAGYTYDKSIYTVEYVVTQNGDILEVVRTITKDGSPAENVVFTNNYVPTSVNGTKISVEKVLIGDKPTTSENFIFILKPEDENNPMPTSGSEISITGAGKAEFGKIEFTKVGTYVYTLTEKNTGVRNYKYDTAVYTVTYIVTDKNGVLEASYTIAKDGSKLDKVEFTNQYESPVTPQTDPTDSVLPESPKTGDTSNLPLWMTLLILSAIGLMGIAFYGKRKKRDSLSTRTS